MSAGGAAGGWVQADRGARAAQVALLADEDREAYLSAAPAQDERFVATYAHVLKHTGGYPPEAARTAARTLLPDVLPYDPTRPAAYPTNGRALTDDVIDLFLRVLTNGKVTADQVGPHTDLLAESRTWARRTTRRRRGVGPALALAMRNSRRDLRVASAA